MPDSSINSSEIFPNNYIVYRVDRNRSNVSKGEGALVAHLQHVLI